MRRSGSARCAATQSVSTRYSGWANSLVVMAGSIAVLRPVIFSAACCRPRRRRRDTTVTIYSEPRFLPCGDLAVAVELGDEISREMSARVLALDYLIQE